MQSSVSQEIQHIEYLQEKVKYLKVIDFFEKSQYLLSQYPECILNLDLNWNGDIKAKIYTKDDFYSHSLDKPTVTEGMINQLGQKFNIDPIYTKVVTGLFLAREINVFAETKIKDFMENLDPEFKAKFLYDTLQQEMPEKNIANSKKPKI